MNIQKKREEMVNLIDNIKDHSDQLKKSEFLNLLELSVIISKINQLHEKALILKFMSAVDQKLELEELGIDDLHVLRKTQEEMEAAMPEYSVEQEEEANAHLEEGVVEGEMQRNDEFISLSNEAGEDNPMSSKEDGGIEHGGLSSTREEEPQEIEEDLTAEVQNKSIMSLEEIEEKIEITGKPDVNEVYTDEQDKSVSARLEKHPINDLLAAIGLNERYLYANELFEGDISTFKEVMQKLDEMNSYDEAKKFFLEDLKVRYSWDDDNELVEALSILIERRYL